MTKQILFHSSFFLICFFFITLVVSNLALLMGFDLQLLNPLIGFFISIVLLIISAKKTRDIIVSIILAVVVSVISYYLAVIYFDTSYDGQGYHQETLYLLKNGWNPLYEESHAYRIWVNLYQKGNELIQATIYLVTNKIESGKMFNLVMIYVSIFVVWDLVDRLQLKRLYKVIISIVLIFNPVVVTQSFTYCVDGNWYLSLLISMVSLLSYFCERKISYLIIFVLSSVFFCSIKFSSIPVFVVLSFFALMYHYLYRKQIMVLPYLSIFLLVGICNVYPFISNVEKGRHVFHPFMGDEKIDIINQNIPEVLLNENRVERLMISLFSKTTNDKKIVLSDALKVPFTFTIDELLLNIDTRLGGFGFLFSGILVVSVILAFYLFFRKGNSSDKTIMVFIITALLVSVLINPASWWARLSAQIWIIPIVFMVFGLLSQDKISQVLSKIVLWVFMVNIFIFGGVTLVKINYNTIKMHRFMNSVGDKTIILDLSNDYGFKQYYLKFKESNIKYKLGKVKDKRYLAPFTNDVYYQIE